MLNKTYALEWIEFAVKNLETAKLLIREKHYTDSIAIEIQQTIEKTLKAIFAYFGISVPKTHSLMVLHNLAEQYISFETFDSEIFLIISDAYETNRYPSPKYFLPERDEVEAHFLFAERLLVYVRDFITK